MRIDGRNDGFERHQVDHLLAGVPLPLDLLVLLDLEDITPLGTVRNYWVGELRLAEPLAIEFVVPGNESHFGLTEDEREEPVLPTPFSCHKMAHEGCELLNEVSPGVECGLPHDSVEQDGFHPLSQHFGDGGHGCRD